jgi:hypothetical protein
MTWILLAIYVLGLPAAVYAGVRWKDFGNDLDCELEYDEIALVVFWPVWLIYHLIAKCFKPVNDLAEKHKQEDKDNG